MNSPNSPIFRGNRLSQRASSRWLTSFGDLLTLLLCFFICIVSLSREKQPDRPTRTRLTTWNDMDSDALLYKQTGKQRGGTGIAPLRDGPQKVTLRFGREDFTVGGEQLSSQAVDWMKSAIDIKGYRVKPHEVVVCAHNGTPGESADWYRAMQRVSDIRSQLIDASLPVEGLSLQVLGSDCGALRGPRAEQQSTVAALQVEYKRDR